jgi:hypothetical protein
MSPTLVRGLFLASLAAGCTGEIRGGDVSAHNGGHTGTTIPYAPGGNGASGDLPGAGGDLPGSGGDGASMMPGSTRPDPLAGPPIRSAGARRLSRQEVARSLQRLLGADVPVDVSLLPVDTLTPFDNDVIEQSPSMRLVEGLETVATDVATWATATPARLQQLLPCTPASASDAACFRQFVERFGRRVLRHPLDADTSQEMQDLISYAKASGKFADAVAAALRVFLMHPEFIYRVEPGLGASGGIVSLTPFEVASRLSFLLQGMTPDDALLTAAEDGTLATPEGLRAHAQRLIASDEGKQQLRRFHALWLGYAPLTSLPIHQKLRAETDALVDRATEPGRDYGYLLLANETRIDAELATHYGLPAPAGGGFAWTAYGSAPRVGVLSHGMFAAAGAKFSDTSPTRRGKFVRERLLCQPVPLPPPTANVDVDLPPAAKTPNACKVERYRQHREQAACAGCHSLMDPIGFGLEGFDELGRLRTHEAGRDDCPIDGAGQLDDDTPFTGATGLAPLVAQSPAFAPCLGEHFLRFAMGRALDDQDRQRAEWMGNEMKSHGNHMVDMLLAFVSHENFRLREE